MMICPICKKEGLKNRNALHAHMLKSHLEEYRAKDCKLEAFGVVKEEPGAGRKEAPEGFRPLNKSHPLERAAYDAGMRYTDGDDVWTAAECKKAGWL
ncbi:hypothetical protein [Sinanaerobacter chloroacetimidivorans]|uniref:Uncharacterized protein n=1 Tax=Sinanaerobacter chloroacetimidivorans TaxID=2818044 RepID=A0A8J8B093_9FIRM|nr:hypothetical protein [Sinanaerobacter chloroacetimidivorans]MBR0596602.1 hypothetical protein [Sinanaerobacter chloroacetimidivorans]